MKKYTIPIIIFTLIIAGLACGSGSTDTKEPTVEILNEENNIVESEDTQESTEKDEVSPEEAIEDVLEEIIEEVIEEETSEDSESDNSSINIISIEEQIVFNQEDIIITVKGLDLDSSFFGPELSVLIENNNEKDITVQVRNVSVNDLMVDTIFSSDVASGKKANDSITFMESDLETASIHTIKNIEFMFHIFDADSWDTIVDSDLITLETIGSEAYIQEFDDTGALAVDTNGIKIVIKKLESEDSFWGADIYVYIENNSAQNITVQVRDVSIDGFMVEPIFSCDVVSGKKAFDTITFFESDLTDNDITDINSIELLFHIFDLESWNNIFDSEIVNITFD